jgi:subtilisin family serine protease
MIRVPQIHKKGFFGEGIKIGVLDGGFDGYNTHAAFDSLRIGGMRDFVDGDDLPLGHDHGTEVLSVMAALNNGSIVGAAPYAEYYLARTENTASELRIEEDNWVAGIEWADSMGVDIVNSSVGYNEFDDYSYTYQDLDGETAITTRAADIAVSKGIVVVVCAGNEGDKAWRYVIVPADGKEVLAIGAVDVNQNITPFSSWGPTSDSPPRIKPDFVAMGENVYVANGAEGYNYNSGTSYSSPLVAGSIALILEANPTWTPADVKAALRNTARDLGDPGPDYRFGYGLIDALAAAGLEDPVVVDKFKMYDPFPQPVLFSLSQRRLYFPLDVPAPGKVLLKIFTFNGDLIYRGETTFSEAGSFRDPGYAVEWDGMNMSGEKSAPGIYFYSMEINGHKKTGKIMVMR